MATLNLGRVRLNFVGEFADNNGQTLVFFDAVTHAGSLYVVKTASVVVDDSDTGNRPPTTAGATDFLRISSGIEFSGEWEGDSGGDSARIYYKNEVVRYGPNSFIALQEVPIGRTNPFLEVVNNTGYWKDLVKGFGNYIPGYDGTQNTTAGDIVRWNGNLYLGLAEGDPGKTPTTDPDLFDRIDGGLTVKGLYQSGTVYENREVVTFHGNTYVVVAALSTSNQPVNQYTGDIDPDWELLTTGFNYVGYYNVLGRYYPNDVVSFNGGLYACIELAAPGQAPSNVPEKYTEIIPSDVLREGDFQFDGFLKRTDGNFGIDSNTYLTGNESISITGEGSGSGSTSINFSLTVDAITNQTVATESEAGNSNTKIFGAVDVGGGNFELRQIDPSYIHPDLFTDFLTTQGIERATGETGPQVTLGLNEKVISTLSNVTETNNVADIFSGDKFMFRDTISQTLKSVTYQQLLEKINTQITGPNVQGVTNFRALIDTPSSYTGYENGYVRVNSSGNALEFVEDDIFVQILVFG